MLEFTSIISLLKNKFEILERYQNRFFHATVYKAEQPRYKYNRSRYSSLDINIGTVYFNDNSNSTCEHN